MCGIVGYIGGKQAAPIIIEGLRRLEYRGSDSAGLAVLNESRLHLRKRQGKIDEGLARVLQSDPIAGTTGIGNDEIRKHANDVIHVPATVEPVFPLLAVVPLQLRAYHIAVERGCDVDKPRNLAKSVTVE